VKKILIAPDSFKDCLSSENVCRFLGDGIKDIYPDAEITIFPFADGGEGTASCINFHRGGRWKKVAVSDPLFRPVFAEYLILEQEKTAVIELARASGLEMLAKEERNPLKTSTFGTGDLIRNALDEGLEKIILTLGGSATVDGGTGIAAALGFGFHDIKGNIIEFPTGGNLSEITRINSKKLHPRFRDAEITIACDVDNLLNGAEGAAKIYGPQKGADAGAVMILEKGLSHLSGIVLKETGFNADSYPGTGAAGGASLFLLAYGKASLRYGFQIISELTYLPDEIKKADLVISGEGKIDRQTAYGKVVSSIAKISAANNKPFAGVAGILEGDNYKLKKELSAMELFSIRDLALNDEDSFVNAPVYLRQIGRLIGKNIIEKLQDHG
jgi:glycerate 2-kinase